MNYKLSEQAEADLIRIYQHGVRSYGLVKADEYYDKLIERFEQIAGNPYLYPSVDYICSGYRRSVCGVDSIFYRIKSDKVEIMSIIGRQDSKNIF